MSEYTVMKNKGHYSLESVERELSYEKKKSQGWEEDYKLYRHHWNSYPENRYVAEYPLNVDIELTTLCNLKCPMCFTTSEDYKKFRTPKFMEFKLFKKVIDEIAGKVPAIRFASSGEQTLHPEFLSFLEYAKKAGIAEISLVTNGSRLDKDFIESLIGKLDWLVVSLDGMHEEYERIRYPMKFTQIVESLQLLKTIKQEKNVNKPVVQIQSLWESIKDNYEEYYSYFSPLVDAVRFEPLIDYSKADKLVYEDDFCCPLLYQRIEVGFDGKVHPCCANNGTRMVVGDASNESIYEVWHGEKLSALRKTHEENKFFKVPTCKDCFLTRKLENGSVEMIGQREFVVKQYVYQD